MKFTPLPEARLWRYWAPTAPYPTGAEAIGVIEREVGDAGVLIRMRSGTYVQGNSNWIRAPDQRRVREAMHNTETVERGTA